MPPSQRRSRALASLDGALALIAVVLIVQMWLLSATLESYLSGATDAALPAALVAGVLFACVFGLYLFVRRVDAASRER